MSNPADVEEIRLEVFKQTGKSIDADDPFFVALAMLSVVAKGIEEKNDEALREMLRIREETKPSSSTFRQTAQVSCQANKAPVNQLKTIAGASLVFAAGMFLGAKDGGALLQGSIGLGLGALVGIMLSYLSVLRIEKQHPSALVDVLDTLVWIEGKIGTGIGASTNWTDTDLLRAAQKTKLSSRTLAACRDVLVRGLAASEAAEKNNVLPPQVFRGLNALRLAKKAGS